VRFLSSVLRSRSFCLSAIRILQHSGDVSGLVAFKEARHIAWIDVRALQSIAVHHDNASTVSPDQRTRKSEAMQLGQLRGGEHKRVDRDHRVHAEVFQGCTPEQVNTSLLDRRVEAVLRKGKYFWYQLDGEGPDILFHFGMTGYLAIKGIKSAKYVRINTDAEWPPRFIKLELTFEDGTTMGFMDARRCGYMCENWWLSIHCLASLASFSRSESHAKNSTVV
jgi:hypothetical protein